MPSKITALLRAARVSIEPPPPALFTMINVFCSVSTDTSASTSATVRSYAAKPSALRFRLR